MEQTLVGPRASVGATVVAEKLGLECRYSYFFEFWFLLELINSIGEVSAMSNNRSATIRKATGKNRIAPLRL